MDTKQIQIQKIINIYEFKIIFVIDYLQFSHMAKISLKITFLIIAFVNTMQFH